ncbi:MAG: hypothetical protein WBA51_16335 [Erythrobacter sp.]
MRKAAIAACGTIALALTAPAQAEKAAESPNLVSTFVEICLMPGVDHSDRLAAVEGAEGWVESPSITYNLEGLQPAPAIGTKARFRSVTDSMQWDGKIDGRKASVLLLTFDDKSRYKNACVLMVEGLKNAMPYGSDLKKAFKAFGGGGKSVDLVHYFEFAGTLKPGKQPVKAKTKVHGEIFTRSQAGSIKETAHIYVAY